MGILSSSVSVTRYKVRGEIESPLMDTVLAGLQKHSIKEIDGQSQLMVSGWTSFFNPYAPDFSGSSFVIGSSFIFSLRIDKKALPSKIIQKQYSLEMDRRLNQSGRNFLSRNEKRELKELITDTLCTKIPATPNIYDIIWDYENKRLWFFSTQKSANEEIETLFYESFKISLIRLFPYVQAEQMAGLSDRQKDILNRLTPTNFST